VIVVPEGIGRNPGPGVKAEGWETDGKEDTAGVEGVEPMGLGGMKPTGVAGVKGLN